MAFRADEAAENGYEQVRNYLAPRTFSPAARAKAEQALSDMVDKCGPVVDSYPTWHPFVAHHEARHPQTYPNDRCGYQGLDHTRYFAHGFVTCPYGRAEEVIDAVDKLPWHHCARITAEELDVELYADGTTPVLVRCEWTKPLETGMLIPKSLAVPLMLEQELPCWRWAEVAEKWETMRPYFLGEPHGSRSSLFVSQETALAMKNVYMAMVHSGMFGPLMMG